MCIYIYLYIRWVRERVVGDGRLMYKTGVWDCVRLMRQDLLCVSVCVSLHVSLCMRLSVCVSLCVYLFLCVSVCVSAPLRTCYYKVTLPIVLHHWRQAGSGYLRWIMVFGETILLTDLSPFRCASWQTLSLRQQHRYVSIKQVSVSLCVFLCLCVWVCLFASLCKCVSLRC